MNKVLCFASALLFLGAGLLAYDSQPRAAGDLLSLTGAGGKIGTAAYDHIVIVMEENHGYSQIIGNVTDAPYINSLATSGTLFTNSFALISSSEPNYFALYSGSTQGITDDGTYFFSVPTLGGSLRAAGYTFVGYVETGSPRQHNPWESFADSSGANNVEQNFSTFPSDFTQLPTVCFVVPNLTDDMHSPQGTIAQADTWLNTNISAYATWAKTHNSLLIVQWDEDDNGAERQHIPTIVVGARVGARTSSQLINHYSVLRTIENFYRLSPLGLSATASQMNLFP